MTEETRGLLIESGEFLPGEMPSPADAKANRNMARTTTANPTLLVIIATVPETIMSFLVDQIQFLTAHDFEVHTITSPGMDKMPGNEALNSVRHEVAMTRAINPFADLVALMKLWRLLRELRPTIVQTRTPKAGLLGMIAAWFARVPVRIYTVDGLPILTQKFLGRIMLAVTEWLSCALATEVLCVGRLDRRYIVASGLCPSGKARVLGDGHLRGVDTEKFNPFVDRESKGARIKDEYAIPRAAPVIGFIGRLVPDKGVAELANAWEKIRVEFPDVHLLLCGYFEPVHPVAAELAERLKSDARVHITGAWLNNMPDFYAAIDVCVLPTYREALSTVAIESGAMKVPVVITRVAGCVEAVRNGVTGLLVEPRDSEAIAIALRRLLKDPGLREKMGAAGRDFVSRHYSAARTSALVLAEYQRLVASLDSPRSRKPSAPRSGGAFRGEIIAADNLAAAPKIKSKAAAAASSTGNTSIHPVS
jgi:glycosyltransferase involved in cell wall biosynthesis